jgi:hypothetical protein
MATVVRFLSFFLFEYRVGPRDECGSIHAPKLDYYDKDTISNRWVEMPK